MGRNKAKPVKKGETKQDPPSKKALAHEEFKQVRISSLSQMNFHKHFILHDAYATIIF